MIMMKPRKQPITLRRLLLEPPEYGDNCGSYRSYLMKSTSF